MEVYNSSLMQSFGSAVQSMSHLNRSHDIQPIGGVLAKLFGPG